MTKEQCKYYENCEAPLCPKDEESVEHGIWYPDEAICRHRSGGGFKWVHSQRNLKQWKADPGLYWNVERLSKKVCQASKGEDPDKN